MTRRFASSKLLARHCRVIVHIREASSFENPNACSRIEIPLQTRYQQFREGLTDGSLANDQAV